MSATLELTRDLISRRSVTPEDAGCQQVMMQRLAAIGFDCTPLRFEDVDNFWAIRGDSGPILCFAGHTDVVPSGAESDWQSAPFEPTEQGDLLYGRGAADMKGSLAAMVTAAERFVAAHPDHSGRIAFLITSDEEGVAANGTVKVVEWLEQQQTKIDWCLVGEPSSSDRTGDTIKNGRRGSLLAELEVLGTQGHVAYPQLADNPIHRALAALQALVDTEWDNGNEFFPATTLQISNINGGTGAVNVIPGRLEVKFGFRFCTESSVESLQRRSIEILDASGIDYRLRWHLSGQPFLTAEGELVDACVASIKTVTGIETELSTAGGTSDGRFIAPTGAQVVELGPVNATIHKTDECTSISELDQLSDIYEGVMSALLAPRG